MSQTEYEKLIKALSELSLKDECPRLTCFSLSYYTDGSEICIEGLDADLWSNGVALNIDFIDKIFKVCQKLNFLCICNTPNDEHSILSLYFVKNEDTPKKLPYIEKD